MRTTRSYIQWLNRVRAEVSGSRLNELPGGDHVQPTVQLEDAGHLTVPHTVPVAWGGAQVAAGGLTNYSGLAVSPTPASGGLMIITASGLTAGDHVVGMVDGAALATLFDVASTPAVPECLSEGPSLALFGFGATSLKTPATAQGFFIFSTDQMPALNVFVRPGRIFYILGRNANQVFTGGLSWQEYPAQPVPQLP